MFFFFFFLSWRILSCILVCLSWSGDPKGLILHLCWTCFCDFNPHLAAFVTFRTQNGLPKEDNLSCPPVEDCKEVKITHSPAWASPFLGTFARIKEPFQSVSSPISQSMIHKELGILALQDGYLDALACHLIGQPLWIVPSSSQHFISESLAYLWQAEQAWTQSQSSFRLWPWEAPWPAWNYKGRPWQFWAIPEASYFWSRALSSAPVPAL